MAGLAALASPASGQTVVFREDFDSPILNTARWSVGTWVKGRNQFGNTPTIANGVASLRFDLYNPAQPGVTMRGTSITVRTPFTRPAAGLELEARVRTNMMPAGPLTSFFTYGADSGGKSDEIDFEFLTNTFANRTGGDRYSLTSYNDWDPDHPERENPDRYGTEVARISGLDVTQFNTLTIRWLADRTEWLINGQVVRSSTAGLPDEPMSLSLNFWAPSSSWISAYSDLLQPVASAGQNQSWFYDVDYVQVRTAPEPGMMGVVLVGGAVLLRRWRPIARTGRIR